MHKHIKVLVYFNIAKIVNKMWKSDQGGILLNETHVKWWLFLIILRNLLCKQFILIITPIFLSCCWLDRFLLVSSNEIYSQCLWLANGCNRRKQTVELNMKPHGQEANCLTEQLVLSPDLRNLISLDNLVKCTNILSFS